MEDKKTVSRPDDVFLKYFIGDGGVNGDGEVDAFLFF